MGAEDGSESTTFSWSPRPLEASHCWRLGWACPEFHPWERNFVSFNIGHSLEDYLMTTVQVSWLWACTIILGGQMVWPHSPLLWPVDLHLHKHMHIQIREEHPKSLSLGSHPSLPLRPSGSGVLDSEWKNPPFACVCVCVCVFVKVTQSCPTLRDPMDYTVHGILQVRILEWVAFFFSRGSSQPRDRTQVYHIAGGPFPSWATREAPSRTLISQTFYVGEAELRGGSCIFCVCPQGAFTVMWVGRAVGHEMLWHIRFQVQGCVEFWASMWAENGE